MQTHRQPINTTLWQSHENYISEFKQHHSTEHVLLKLINNLFIPSLILADLSATFDIVNHEILIECFEPMVGLWGCNGPLIHWTFAVNIINMFLYWIQLLALEYPKNQY